MHGAGWCYVGYRGSTQPSAARAHDRLAALPETFVEIAQFRGPRKLASKYFHV